MKKIVLTMLAVCVSGPILAQETPVAAPKDGKPAMEERLGQGHEAFTKAHKEQMAKIKAKKDEMSKLVEEYNKLKDGKKKDAKLAEIKKKVKEFGDEKSNLEKTQLENLDKRVVALKEKFAKENTEQAKEEWVNKKTDELIANNGDLRVLFEPRVGQGPRLGGPKGPHMKDGPKKGGWFHKKGPRMGGRDKGKVPPPPDAELPVQRPVDK